MKYTMALALVAALVASASAQSPASILAPSGVLRGGFLGGNPVHARRNATTGAWEGVVPDLIVEMARRMNVPSELVPLANAGAVSAAVRENRVDIAFLAFDEERAREVDFGAPFLVMLNSYLVAADSPIRSNADVDRSGGNVAAVRGQTQQLFVSRTLRNATVRIFDSMPSQAEVERLLRSGDVSAFAINRQRALEAQASSSSTLRALDDSFLNVNQSVVVRKLAQEKREVSSRFVADILASGFVKDSIARARVLGVDLPSPNAR